MKCKDCYLCDYSARIPGTCSILDSNFHICRDQISEINHTGFIITKTINTPEYKRALSIAKSNISLLDRFKYYAKDKITSIDLITYYNILNIKEDCPYYKSGTHPFIASIPRPTPVALMEEDNSPEAILSRISFQIDDILTKISVEKALEIILEKARSKNEK